MLTESDLTAIEKRAQTRFYSEAFRDIRTLIAEVREQAAAIKDAANLLMEGQTLMQASIDQYAPERLFAILLRHEIDPAKAVTIVTEIGDDKKES
jgi:hypothetical protein